MGDNHGFDEAFLFLQPGADPDTDRDVIDHPGGRTALVWVPDAGAAARVGAELAEGGVRLIELYRGFDLDSAAQVIDAVDGRAPVGVAGFGFGASDNGNTDTTISRSATIYKELDADPGVTRTVRDHGDGWTRVVAASSPSAAAKAAVELVDSGAELIEICGGTPLTTAEQVRQAVAGRAAVSLVSWPFESIDGVAAFKAAYEAKVS